jgi:hypothetical protein
MPDRAAVQAWFTNAGVFPGSLSMHGIRLELALRQEEIFVG